MFDLRFHTNPTGSVPSAAAVVFTDAFNAMFLRTAQNQLTRCMTPSVHTNRISRRGF